MTGGSKPWEVHMAMGTVSAYVDSYETYGQAVSMVHTLDAEDRQRFN